MGWTVTSTIRNAAPCANGGPHGVENRPENRQRTPCRTRELVMHPLDVAARPSRTDLRLEPS
jgi:hypothetical protein